MISVIIPTLNAEASLTATLTALVPGVVEGVIREVIVVDAGSSDRTLKIVEASGATMVVSPARGRGAQLALGAEHARGDWLMFLHADTVLDAGWEREAATFMERIETGNRPEAAAAFQFGLDDIGFLPRVVEFGVRLRCTLFRLPYGDQALIVPRRLYNAVGGMRPLALMEDIDFVSRLGRSRTIILRTRAITSALRFQREGYLMRVLRNQACLAMYFLRVPNRLIERVYSP
ncbi:MAG: TIGR04283 family arsenosugar biosynthesis glycosyltransferase [Pseudomonadota bacterium]